MIKDKTITFSASFDQSFANKLLLSLAAGDSFEGLSFIKLGKKLKLDFSAGWEEWKLLRLHLMQMEEEGLIEERHFEDGSVDYLIENKGMEVRELISKKVA